MALAWLQRLADHLRLLGMRDAAGVAQTLHTTDEHPFYVPGSEWTASKALAPGDGLLGPAGVSSSVLSNIRQSHPAGVAVYNMEVEGAHTYFVRAQGSAAEPVWVHNASPGYGDLYETGTYNHLKYTDQFRSANLQDTVKHHVVSRLRGKELIADFASGEMAGMEHAIRLLKSEADVVDVAARIRPEIPVSARKELAWQIRELRQNTNVPNSVLRDFINQQKQLREWDFGDAMRGH